MHELRYISLVLFHLLSLFNFLSGSQLCCSSEALYNTGPTTLDHVLLKVETMSDFAHQCLLRAYHSNWHTVKCLTCLTVTNELPIITRYSIPSFAKYMNFNSVHQKHISSSPHSSSNTRGSYAFAHV